MARLKSCAWCGKIHWSSYDCGMRPKRYKESTEQTRLRTCRKWDKTRHKIYDRDNHLCRICLSHGHIKTDELEAHHIIPLHEAPDMAYDLDNIITLCARHHKAADLGKIDREKLRELSTGPFAPLGSKRA